MTANRASREREILSQEVAARVEEDARWYKRAVIYQAHVRAFYDSDRDGIGDFRGLTEKLDYIRDLGADVLWLLPFYPSPLRDGGYDIADYTDVNPAYGSLGDFREFVQEAHRRGIRVMTELVLNHTSDQHPWFQRARSSPPGSEHRDFYVWSDTPDRYRGTRIIFKDFESSNWSWDPVAKAYYWHRFYNHQPDLNWDNPAVEREMLRIIDIWLDAGVDGMRLDAVPYLYQREGTTCENLPETHDALRRIRGYIDAKYPGRVLLAEANQWPEDAVAYFGDGDECHMAFHFPLMPRLYMSMETEDRFPLIDILQQTPQIPDACQWTIFLRNHDELTLEMVSDEERDYMYRTFATDPRARINLGIRRRLAPLLGNNRRKIELLHGLLFSFNGTPVIYYGDEIGMGDNIYLGDRDGVRTPMQWSADRNAGFSSANPQQLYLPVNIDPEYRYEAVNVEAQQRNMNSLYWWMKRAISLRRRYHVFGEGELEFLYPDNPRILAFIRKSGDQAVLVVANLARSVQYAELDLSAYEGRVPIELFGRTRFPPIGQLPYLLTLAPHAFYWLDLSVRRGRSPEMEVATLPSVALPGSWAALFGERGKGALEEILPEVLLNRRWFGGKAKSIDEVEILDAIAVPIPGSEQEPPRIAVVRVSYVGGEVETYTVPMALTTGAEARRMLSEHSWAALARVTGTGEEDGLLFDALDLPELRLQLLAAIRGADGGVVAGGGGLRGLRGLRTRAFAQLEPQLQGEVGSTVMRAEQSNTSINFQDTLVLKVFRKLDEGVNPDLEIGRHLTERTDFAHFPAVVGALEYLRDGSEPFTLGLAQTYVMNQGDAWAYTRAELGMFLERVLSAESFALEAPPGAADAGEWEPAFHLALETIGSYLHLVGLLGQRTAELHGALAARHDDPLFAPEQFTPHYQRGLYQSMRSLTARTFELLKKALPVRGAAAQDAEAREMAEAVLGQHEAIYECFARALKSRILHGKRIRCHGDYHLGQVLFTGRDWMIIDFEGEPARSLGERRIKRSPLRDVAGMLRSFSYAEHDALRHAVATGSVERDSEAFQRLLAAGASWRAWVAETFLRSYIEAASALDVLPPSEEERRLLLDAYLLEKAIYELNYELNNRPHMIGIPVRGILELVEKVSAPGSAPQRGR